MVSVLRLAPIVAIALVLCLTTRAADAHVAEQAFVLLLPTDIYITAGVIVVALTVLLTVFLPASWLTFLFRPVTLIHVGRSSRRALSAVSVVTSTLCCALTFFLITLGFLGARDPLSNPLPLAVWALFWISLISLQGVFGDLWRWLNPWSGPYALFRGLIGNRPLFRLPRQIGCWPALLLLVGFTAFLLADPAPADPARLARLVVIYWLFIFTLVALFGRRTLQQIEFLSVLLGLYRRVAIFGGRDGSLAASLPGWQLVLPHRTTWSIALFATVLLGSGSFDGLNETFWWLATIDVNPLEFPGRSAVIAETITGLLASNLLLILVFAVTTLLGTLLAHGGRDVVRRFAQAFRLFAPALLPIALGYHIGHYLTSFLVEIQYALAAASDPWATGADYLGLGTFYVTTGFFNTQATIEVIWLTQAGVIVVGHVLSVLVAHAQALQLYANHKQALLSQLPLSVFMIAYTVFGLWLLAAPRGA